MESEPRTQNPEPDPMEIPAKPLAHMTEREIAALCDWIGAKSAIEHLRGIREDNRRRRRSGHPAVPAMLEPRQVSALCDFLNVLGDRL